MPIYTLETHYLDVGQGDSSLIVIKDLEKQKDTEAEIDPQVVRSIVIDCGTDRKSEIKKGELGKTASLTLIDKIIDLRIETVDIVIISHYDRDHFNGIIWTLRSGNWIYFKQAVFYDIGSMLTNRIDYTKTELCYVEELVLNTSLTWAKNYRLYTEALYDSNNHYGGEIKRPTERVYCGWPPYFENGRPKNEMSDIQPTNHRDQSLDVIAEDWYPLNEIEDLNNDLITVDFGKCHSLLGKDFINDSYENDEDKIPIHLYCLAVNGWVYNPKTKKSSKVNLTKDRKNAFSIGALLKFGEYTAWFGGDLPTSMETKLIPYIQHYAPNGLSVLKAAHHGSAESTNKEFVNGLRPKCAIVTCGEGGTHGHPTLEVIKSLNQSATLKKVIVTGFGGDPYYGSSYDHIVLRSDFREVGFPTDISDPYNPDGKFALSGSGDYSEPGNIAVYAGKEGDDLFEISFFTGFKRAELHEPMDDEPADDPDITYPIMTFSSQETVDMLLDTKTNENRTILKNGHFYMKAKKRKRKEDDEGDPPYRKKRRLLTIGETVKLEYSKPKQMNEYTINPEKIINPLGATLELFSPDWLTIPNPEVNEIEGSQREISGNVQTSWINSNIGLDFSSVYISLHESSDLKQIEIASITAVQQVNGTDIHWEVSDPNTGSLIFTTNHFDEFPLDIEQAQKLPFFKNLDVIGHFVHFDTFSYQLHLSGFRKLSLSYIWHSSAKTRNELSVGNDLFSINEFGLSGLVNVQNHQEESIRLYTDLNLSGLETKVVFRVNSLPDYTVQILPKENSFFDDLSRVLGVLKLNHFEGSIKAFNAEFDLLKRFNISSVTLRLKKNLSSLSSVALVGQMIAFDSDFNFKIIYSKQNRFRIELRLNTNDSPDFNTLFGRIFHENLQLPINPTVQTLKLTAGFNPILYDFTLGLHNVWEIPVGNKKIKLERLNLRAGRVDSGQHNFRLNAQLLIVGIDFALEARKAYTNTEHGWFLETKVAHQKRIHLREFIKGLGDLCDFIPPEDDHIPDLSINHISASFHTESHDFSFQMGVELDSPIGPFEKGALNLMISLKKNEGSHHFSMDLDGFVDINEIHIGFAAENIGQANWAAEIRYEETRHEGMMDLESLCQFFDPELSITDEQLSSLALSEFSIDYQHNDRDEHSLFADLKITTKNGSEIEGFFSGQHDSTGWNIAAGFGYEDHHHETEPAILQLIPDTLSIEGIWFVFMSSHEQRPKLPETIAPMLEDEEISTGLALVAKLDLKEHQHIPGSDHLIEKGHEELDVLIELTNNGIRFEASLGGSFIIPTGQNHDITIENPKLIFQVGSPVALIIGGKFFLQLDGFEQTLAVNLSLGSDGINLNLDLKFADGGWNPFGLDSLHIDELAFQLGVDFIPPGLRIGFLGDAHFGDLETAEEITGAQDEFAIVLSFTEPIPNPEYLAVKINHLSMSDIMDLFPGAHPKGHPVISDDVLTIDDFELIWCEKPLILPNGKSGEVGFNCHGLLTILGWRAYAMLEVHPNTGIQGALFLDPLTIGPMTLTGNSPGIFINREEVNGKLVVISNVNINTRSTGEVPDTTIDSKEVIKPNGAMIQFNSSGSPYLNMSFKLEILKVNVLEVHAEITDTKFEFDFALDLVVLSIKSHCLIDKSKNHFEISGAFFLGLNFDLKIDLGFIHINVHVAFGVNATLYIKKERRFF